MSYGAPSCLAICGTRVSRPASYIARAGLGDVDNQDVICGIPTCPLAMPARRDSFILYYLPVLGYSKLAVDPLQERAACPARPSGKTARATADLAPGRAPSTISRPRAKSSTSGSPS